VDAVERLRVDRDIAVEEGVALMNTINLPRSPVHDLRHTSATLLLAQGFIASACRNGWVMPTSR
jgi:integrase